MPKPTHTRHLAGLIGHADDYLYDKKFKRGAAGRRTRKRVTAAMTRRRRQELKRATEKVVAETT